jgi:hypothetical protein
MYILKEIRGKYLQRQKKSLAPVFAPTQTHGQKRRGGLGVQPNIFTTMRTTSIVINLLIVVPFFVFRTTKTHVIVRLYPNLPYLIVFWA